MIRFATLFSDHPNLIKGFHKFLPDGYTMELRTDNMGTVVVVVTPNDRRNIYVIKRADRTGANRESMSGG
jgi:histone deacetylase complex regulatory component SIN3